MSWDNYYTLINALVVPGWLLLVFLPQSGITRTLVHSAVYPLIMGAIYIAGLIAAMVFGQSAGEFSFSTISGITALFSHPNGVITGWSHYLVFDLFVGAWIGRDALRRGIPHLATIPCLIGAFMFGPVGLFLYVCLWLVTGKGGFSLFEDT